VSVPSKRQSDGLPSRLAQTLLSPRCRLAALLVLLSAAAISVVVYEPQQYVTDGLPAHLSGGLAGVLFTVSYGLCTAAFVPRPVLNVAAGALFGTQAGTAAAVVGTVIGSGLAFGLGRLLGQDALRPMLRKRWLTSADRQLSRHGFRSMLFIRLLPGVPFAASNYGAAVSRMGWTAFLTATALGVVPNTAAYVIAGSHAASPTSPLFLAAFAFIALSGLGGAVLAWRKRALLGGSAPADSPSTAATYGGTPDGVPPGATASGPVTGTGPAPGPVPASAAASVTARADVGEGPYSGGLPPS
jgi:uncharacterized membrane protein YdjX (TVP38/TMEM64 family)